MQKCYFYYNIKLFYYIKLLNFVSEVTGYLLIKTHIVELLKNSKNPPALLLPPLGFALISCMMLSQYEHCYKPNGFKSEFNEVTAMVVICVQRHKKILFYIGHFYFS